MTVNGKFMQKHAQTLPTLTDVDAGRVTLDEYEIAHGEDSPELTEDIFARARPASDFPELANFFRQRGERGPQKAPVKERIGLRLDRKVIDYFRHTGPGWQSRINDVLAEHIKAVGK